MAWYNRHPGIMLILCIGTAFICAGTLIWLITPVEEIKTIVVKDKCCSETGQCYVFDEANNKYTAGSSGNPNTWYYQMSIGETYRIKTLKFSPLSSETILFTVMTMEEYAQSCEKRGMC